jgi:hypothetical protein
MEASQMQFCRGIIGLICVGLCSVSLLAQSGYGTIHVGGSKAGLPFPCADDNCEGEYQSQWVEVFSQSGVITTIDVVYSGITLSEDPIERSPISLAQAIKLHSMQPGFKIAVFGLAKNRRGEIYGVVDVANDIIYSSVGADPESKVAQVSYVGPDAPALADARALKMMDYGRALLLAAKVSKSYVNSIAYSGDGRKAASHKEAVDGLEKRAATVAKSGQLLLTLTVRLLDLYRVDSGSPDAISGSGELKFRYPTYSNSWRDLVLYMDANKALFTGDDLLVIPFAQNDEIDSKMRQLEHLGFQR